MFCGNCGTRNPDDAVFCMGCGMPLHGGQRVMPAAMPRKKKPYLAIGIGIAVAVVLVLMVPAVLLGMTLFGGRSEEETLQQFVDAEFDADVEAIMELLPDGTMEYVLEEEGYAFYERNEMIEDVEEDLQDQLDILDSYMGEGWEISYEVVTEDDLSGWDLKNIQEVYEAMDVKVSAAKTFGVRLIVSGQGMNTSKGMNISMVKVGRSWYLDFISMGGLL